ncbi:MAG: alpha-L-fucosidase [Saprospiraceae bacterium]
MKKDPIKFICWLSVLGMLIFNGCKSSSSGIWPEMPPNPIVAVPPGYNAEQIAQLATEVRPELRQMKWQEQEFIGFIHFGMNTFTGNEWGTGTELPSQFSPSNLDPSQWIRTAKLAGMKGLIFTAKHHDGFCMWPSKWTDHSIKNSPADPNLMKSLADSCHAAGLSLGFYLSPADLHEMLPGKRYGNGSKSQLVYIPSGHRDSMPYLVDDYNKYYMEQLAELLLNYGPVSEIWLDGANPKPGSQTYDYQAWYQLIRRLQPNAVIAVKGPDVRWCGNEAGNTRGSEWSVIPLDAPVLEQRWQDRMEADLGSRDKLAKAKFLYWYPAETNTSMRYGWFYRDTLQFLKGQDELLDVWYNSVGGNSVFLLNMTPDRTGQIPRKDAATLEAMGAEIKRTFSNNLALKADVITIHENARYRSRNLTDGNSQTVWTPALNAKTYELYLEFDKGFKEFNVVELREPISKTGQRIESFTIDAWIDNHWEEIGKGQTVGYRKLIRSISVRSNQLRLRILSCRGMPVLSEIAVYNREIRMPTPTIRRDKQGRVFFSSIPSSEKFKYTIDGTIPTFQSETFFFPVDLPQGGTVKAISVSGNRRSMVASASFDIPPTKWRISKFSSQLSTDYYSANNAIDGDPATIWISNQSGGNLPQSLSIDFGDSLSLRGLSYQAPIDIRDGLPQKIEIRASNNGKDWVIVPLISDKLDNVLRDRNPKKIMFSAPLSTRYIQWNFLETADGKPFISAAELGVITR